MHSGWFNLGKFIKLHLVASSNIQKREKVDGDSLCENECGLFYQINRAISSFQTILLNVPVGFLFPMWKKISTQKLPWSSNLSTC